MPWCPNCKLEYQEGIAVCSDCQTPLVQKLPDNVEASELIMRTAVSDLADRFLDFLSYSHIRSGTKSFSLETEEYQIFVSAAECKEAQKLYQAFSLSEAEGGETNKEPIPEQISESAADDLLMSQLPESERAKATAAKLRNEASDVYVPQKAKYEDLLSSARMFFVFGILGLLFTAANAAGWISMLHGPLPFTVYTALFAGCILIGLTTKKRALEAKAQIDKEDQLTAKVRLWLEENMTKELWNALSDSSLSDEANYIQQTTKIRQKLLEALPQTSNSMADEMIEEYYSEHFE